MEQQLQPEEESVTPALLPVSSPPILEAEKESALSLPTELPKTLTNLKLKVKAYKRRQITSLATGFLLLSGIFFLQLVTKMGLPIWMNDLGVLFLLIFNIANIVNLYTFSRTLHEIRDYSQQQLNDTASIGDIVEAMTLNDSKIRAWCKENVTRLLPQLKASDSHLLNARHREILTRQIANQKAPMRNYGAYQKQHTEFTVTVLKAFEQIGDASAIPTVQSLAESHTVNDRIRNAARHCLPFLLGNREKRKVSQTLLRPASATNTDNASEILLRPASGVQQTAPDQLLRATTQQDSEPN